MREKIQDGIKNSVLVKTPKHLIPWCNQYRLVPKANEDMRLVVDMREVNQFMVQKHFKMEETPYLTRSHSEEQLRNFVRPKRSLQPCPGPSNISELTGNTIHGNYIHILGNALWSE
jgi:hypothetical protein